LYPAGACSILAPNVGRHLSDDMMC